MWFNGEMCTAFVAFHENIQLLFIYFCSMLLSPLLSSPPINNCLSLVVCLKSAEALEPSYAFNICAVMRVNKDA